MRKLYFLIISLLFVQLANAQQSPLLLANRHNGGQFFRLDSLQSQWLPLGKPMPLIGSSYQSVTPIIDPYRSCLYAISGSEILSISTNGEVLSRKPIKLPANTSLYYNPTDDHLISVSFTESLSPNSTSITLNTFTLSEIGNEIAEPGLLHQQSLPVSLSEHMPSLLTILPATEQILYVFGSRFFTLSLKNPLSGWDELSQISNTLPEASVLLAINYNPNDGKVYALLTTPHKSEVRLFQINPFSNSVHDLGGLASSTLGTMPILSTAWNLNTNQWIATTGRELFSLQIETLQLSTSQLPDSLQAAFAETNLLQRPPLFLESNTLYSPFGKRITWQRNNHWFRGPTSSNTPVSAAGRYAYGFKDFAGNNYASKSIHINQVASPTKDFYLYPNPSKSYHPPVIHLPEDDEVLLYDASGKLVHSQTYPAGAHEFYFRTFAKGFYLIRSRNSGHTIRWSVQ